MQCLWESLNLSRDYWFQSLEISLDEHERLCVLELRGFDSEAVAFASWTFQDAHMVGQRRSPARSVEQTLYFRSLSGVWTALTHGLPRSVA